MNRNRYNKKHFPTNKKMKNKVNKALRTVQPIAEPDPDTADAITLAEALENYSAGAIRTILENLRESKQINDSQPFVLQVRKSTIAVQPTDSEEPKEGQNEEGHYSEFDDISQGYYDEELDDDSEDTIRILLEYGLEEAIIEAFIKRDPLRDLTELDKKIKSILNNSEEARGFSSSPDANKAEKVISDEARENNQKTRKTIDFDGE